MAISVKHQWTAIDLWKLELKTVPDSLAGVESILMLILERVLGAKLVQPLEKSLEVNNNV